MTNKKSTLKALIASLLSVVLCLSMLVGSTFAWFTDTATTNVNTIQAGTLDIEFLMEEKGEWVPAIDKTLEFVTADGRPNEDILWEPGATFILPAVKLGNLGNLALKFKLLINGVTGDLALANVLDVWVKVDNGEWNKTVGTLADLMADPNGVAYGIILPEGKNVLDDAPEDERNITVSGSTPAYTVALHMQEEAGNEYQGMFLGGMTFTAYASQYTYEYDSFGNQYDENALSVQEQNVLDFVADGYTKVSSGEELKSAFTNNDNKVVLASDITLEDNDKLTVAENNEMTLELNGYTLSGVDTNTTNVSNELIEIGKGATLTIDDSVGTGKIVYSATTDRGWNAYSAVISNMWSKLIVNGGTIEHQGGTDMAYAIDNRSNTGSDDSILTVNGGVIKSTYIAIRLFANSTEGFSIVTINDGAVEGTSRALWIQSPNANANKASLTVNGGAQIFGNLQVTATGSVENITMSVVKATLNGELRDSMNNGIYVETNGVVSIQADTNTSVTP